MDFALTLAATVTIYKECALKAAWGIVKNWPILIGSVVLFVSFFFIGSIFSIFGSLQGILMGLVSVAFLSIYYGWISAIADKEIVTFQKLIKFDVGLFFNIMNVGFYLWIGDVIFKQSFERVPGMEWLPACFGLVIFIVFNSLPEIVHQHRQDGMSSFYSALNFNKENWIEWHIPLLIILSPILFSSWRAALMLLSGASVLLPISTVMSVLLVTLSSFWLVSYITIFLALVVGNWYMLFRVFLFKELEGGTRRRRVYQAKQKI